MPLDVVARFEALHDARLPGATVTDEHHFEQEVECVVGGRQLHQCGRIATCHFRAAIVRTVVCMCGGGVSVSRGHHNSRRGDGDESEWTGSAISSLFSAPLLSKSQSLTSQHAARKFILIVACCNAQFLCFVVSLFNDDDDGALDRIRKCLEWIVSDWTIVFSIK